MSDAFPGPDEMVFELADDLRGRAKSELEPGERLFWAARSTTRPRPSPQVVTALVCIAGLLATSLVCFVVSAFSRTASEPAVVLAVLCGIISLLTLVGTTRSFMQWRNELMQAIGTCYALTDRRAIIWVPQDRWGAVAVHSVRCGQVYQVHRIERPDGSGDVVFSATLLPGHRRNPLSGLFGVPEVRKVEDLTRRVLIAPRSRGSELEE
jgi:hypothetical protein